MELSYLFLSFCILFCGTMVVVVSHQVHALIYLISSFIFITITLLVHYNIQYLAFVIIIVYIGAVAMLFLFVVMMLDIRVPQTSYFKMNRGQMSFLVPVLCFSWFLGEYFLDDLLFTQSNHLIFLNGRPSCTDDISLYDCDCEYRPLLTNIDIQGELDKINRPRLERYSKNTDHWLDVISHQTSEGSDVRVIAKVLYSIYGLPTIISAVVLLVAMMGAITLTLKHKPFVKNQNSYLQLNRSFEEAVKRYR